MTQSKTLTFLPNLEPDGSFSNVINLPLSVVLFLRDPSNYPHCVTDESAPGRPRISSFRKRILIIEDPERLLSRGGPRKEFHGGKKRNVGEQGPSVVFLVTEVPRVCTFS